MPIGEASAPKVSQPGGEVLVVAALSEELDTALGLCGGVARSPVRGIRAWDARRGDRAISFLKTGVGPARAERSLILYLERRRPARILAFGYAGALREGFQIGDLVALERASLLGLEPATPGGVSGAELEGTWQLDADPWRSGGRERVDALTSPHIIGDPRDKRVLHGRFGASVVDMETAVLARAAAAAAIPLACVRAITDLVDDDFLAPFGYVPQAGPALRAARALAAGRWIGRYRDWKVRAERARSALSDFLAGYL
jgi:hypothetical protein